MTKIPQPESAVIADVQSSADTRQIAINRVGIKDIKYPLKVKDFAGDEKSTVANVSMYVNLQKHVKGTHMSRFIEILNENEEAVSVNSLKQMLVTVKEKLGSDSAYIELNFPYFIQKKAPITGVESLMDYDVSFFGNIENNKTSVELKVVVPVTSLCPCSKKISDHGAHNQRSHVTVSVVANAFISIEELISYVEKEASCELFGLLKRPDEKYITEYAYENPKFVEDVVRDVAVRLNEDERISEYKVESENFESIHNHSAYACIEKEK